MIGRILNKAFIVEDDNWFKGDDLKTYSVLLDVAIDTVDKDQRVAALTRIRKMAFDYIDAGNMLGYQLIADWNVLQYQTDNALTYYMKSGLPATMEKIEKYKVKAESSAGSCILLGEAYFLNGNDSEGIRYLKKCKELGCSGAEGALRLHSKGPVRVA